MSRVVGFLLTRFARLVSGSYGDRWFLKILDYTDARTVRRASAAWDMWLLPWQRRCLRVHRSARRELEEREAVLRALQAPSTLEEEQARKQAELLQQQLRQALGPALEQLALAVLHNYIVKRHR